MKIPLAAIAALAASTAQASLAAAAELGDAGRGLAYAKEHCAECHAVSPSQPQSPRIGVATFKTIAGTPGMTEAALGIWLQTPHKSMPNLILMPADRDDVIAYIVSLKERNP